MRRRTRICAAAAISAVLVVLGGTAVAAGEELPTQDSAVGSQHSLATSGDVEPAQVLTAPGGYVNASREPVQPNWPSVWYDHVWGSVHDVADGEGYECVALQRRIQLMGEDKGPWAEGPKVCGAGEVRNFDVYVGGYNNFCVQYRVRSGLHYGDPTPWIGVPSTTAWCD